MIFLIAVFLFIIMIITISGILFIKIFIQKVNPNSFVLGCKGINCKSQRAVGYGSTALPCYGDFCQAGNCIGEGCKAGDCYGYGCKGGDCYGYGCQPGICYDTRCLETQNVLHASSKTLNKTKLFSNSYLGCPPHTKSCNNGRAYDVKRPFYYQLTRFLPENTILNPPICYTYTTVKDVRDGRLNGLGIKYLWLSKHGIVNYFRVFKNDIDDNEIVLNSYPQVIKNNTCEYCLALEPSKCTHFNPSPIFQTGSKPVNWTQT